MKFLLHFFGSLYAYCVDFLLNLADLTGLSYYEINFFIFCLSYPLLTCVLLVIYWRRRRKEIGVVPL
jgi:hypothetical protein